MKRLFQPLLLCLIINLIVSGCMSARLSDASRITNDDRVYTTRVQVPDEFSDKENPLGDAPQALEQGEIMYQVNCASCHGVTGRGDGVAASSFEPRPDNLASDQKDLSDAYLYWRIYAGGAFEPFRSVMPGWRSLLTEDDIWRIITYIRSLEG
jgi:mono/diheme cytochrome c family protein